MHSHPKCAFKLLLSLSVRVSIADLPAKAWSVLLLLWRCKRPNVTSVARVCKSSIQHNGRAMFYRWRAMYDVSCCILSPWFGCEFASQYVEQHQGSSGNDGYVDLEQQHHFKQKTTAGTARNRLK